jgi:hypothetical protein
MYCEEVHISGRLVVVLQDVLCSTKALSELQNFNLPSCDRGGMRLEYPFFQSFSAYTSSSLFFSKFNLGTLILMF